MKNEIVEQYASYLKSLELIKNRLHFDTASLRLEELNHLTSNNDLWNDAQNAQKLMKERNELASSLEKITLLSDKITTGYDFIELAEMEHDESLLQEAETSFLNLSDDISAFELSSLLSHEADSNDAFLEIHSGAGGTESQDWA